jgi:uncharacterized membrane protein YfcA
MWQKSKLEKHVLSPRAKKQLCGCGILSFFLDTIGVGSFAVNIAIGKTFGLIKDRALPAFANGAQVLPGAVSALFFMKFIPVDAVTLFSLVMATTVGGALGGVLISSLNTHYLKIVMIMAFVSIALLLIATEFRLVSIGGSATALSGSKLWMASLLMVVSGALTAAGVGLFAMTQAVLFLFGMSPIVAFPIMTVAGAVSQPVTSMVFSYKNEIPQKESLIVGVAGLIGVALALPLVANLSPTGLHFLLASVLIYNSIRVGLTFREGQRALEIFSEDTHLKN